MMVQLIALPYSIWLNVANWYYCISVMFVFRNAVIDRNVRYRLCPTTQL